MLCKLREVQGFTLTFNCTCGAFCQVSRIHVFSNDNPHNFNHIGRPFFLFIFFPNKNFVPNYRKRTFSDNSDNVTNERTRTSVLSGYGIGWRGLQVKFANFLNIFLLVKVSTCHFDSKAFSLRKQ